MAQHFCQSRSCFVATASSSVSCFLSKQLVAAQPPQSAASLVSPHFPIAISSFAPFSSAFGVSSSRFS
jgi:hypothetical protein